MGKHKEKFKKHKKDKKKNKRHKRRYTSSSSSSSEDEWVEKKINSNSSSDEEILKNKQKRKLSSNSSSSEDEVKKKTYKLSACDNKAKGIDEYKEEDKNSENSKRGEWMNLPTSFLTSSNIDRKQRREEQKQLERQKKQYNPRECSRELNPYWKDGGDGLPKFKKPENFQGEYTERYSSKRDINKVSKWRKKESEERPKSKLDENKLTENKVNSGCTKMENDSNLSEKELNILAAKLVKAEIMGNTKLINELKEKLENARNCRNINVRDNSKETDIVLTHTDSQGQSRPVKSLTEYGESSGYHKRKKNVETHKDGQRVRYFADDDKYSLKQMFEAEKYNSAEDQNSEFIKMASKISKNDDLDDIFSDNIRKKESDHKIDSRNRDRAINESQRISKSLDNCDKCIQSENMLKHLMISMGETNYLAIPSYEPLTEGHCLIIPIRHVPCSTQLDENEWSDILNMRRSLVNLFKYKDEDVIFFETAMLLHRFPHMYIECVPLPKNDGEVAPIYFKKAIDESEIEWAQNKKLISLKGRDVRKAIPKGLPYFAVSFGMEEGYAHVIEDERSFPSNFAQEIIGGMLDLHHSKWRKPRKQSFEDQSKRVLEFSKDWKNFDCTV